MSSKESKEETIVVSSSPSITRWWSKETVAVVTGANKGIGLALVKKLAELGLTVVLTARNSVKGLEAVNELLNNNDQNNLNIHFYCLDVANPNSIQAFAAWLRETFGVLDLLINNAAVSFNDLHENSIDKAEIVIRTNYYGPKMLTEALLPLFRRSSSTAGRILNISSRLGSLNKLSNPRIKEMLLDEENMSENKIDWIINLFLENVKNGTWKSQGWPQVWTDYAVSKLALNAYSKVLAKRYVNTKPAAHCLVVNCFCPGFTKTSMTGGKGVNTPEAVAEIATGLALLRPEELTTGKFYVVGSSSNTIYSKL